MTISQSPKLNVLGKVAISTGIAAAVLSLVLGVTIIETTPHQQHPEFLWRFREWPYALCGIVFLILASVAFACGLTARRTGAGNAGVGLAAFGCAHLGFLSASVGVPFVMLIMISGRWLLEGKPERKAGPPEAQADRPSGSEQEQTRSM
jgi:hypothetical protein